MRRKEREQIRVGDLVINIRRTSRRKTMAIHVEREGVEVRTPLSTPNTTIRKIVINDREWINKRLKVFEDMVIPTVKAKPVSLLVTRVHELAKVMGVNPAKVTIRVMKTRWGSAGKNGNITLNEKLTLAPDPVIDSVIIHELCHLVHHNHSPAFWELVKGYDKNLATSKEWLRKNGLWLA